jgi:8-oxo-dGTP pyrophosphatase MutT (NUDIX family)
MESTKQQGELKMEAVQQLYQAQSQTVHKLETQIKRLGDFILSLDCGFPTINDEYPTGMGATEAAEEYIKQLRRLGAAVSASPQPRCPKCGSEDLRMITDSNSLVINMYCLHGHDFLNISWPAGFRQFFAAAPAQEPRRVKDFDWQCDNCGFRDDPTIPGKPAICSKCGWNRWSKVSAAQEQPVENSPCTFDECDKPEKHGYHIVNEGLPINLHNHKFEPVAEPASTGEPEIKMDDPNKDAYGEDEPVLSESDLAELDRLQITHPNLWQWIRDVGKSLLYLQQEVTLQRIELAARPADPSAQFVQAEVSGNPSCHVCGEPMGKVVRLKMPEGTSQGSYWQCKSCGTSTEPSAPQASAELFKCDCNKCRLARGAHPFFNGHNDVCTAVPQDAPDSATFGSVTCSNAVEPLIEPDEPSPMIFAPKLVGDAPKVEDIARKLHLYHCQERRSGSMCPCHAVAEGMTEGCHCKEETADIAAILRPYFPPASQTPEYRELFAELYQIAGVLHYAGLVPTLLLDKLSAVTGGLPIPKGELLPFMLPENLLPPMIPGSHLAPEGTGTNQGIPLATPASTALTDGWVSGNKYTMIFALSPDFGSVALLLKPDTHHNPLFRSKWTVPGGLLEAGESEIDGAVREFEEETQLTVPPKDLRFVMRFLCNCDPTESEHEVLVYGSTLPIEKLNRAKGSSIEPVGVFSEIPDNAVWYMKHMLPIVIDRMKQPLPAAPGSVPQAPKCGTCDDKGVVLDKETDLVVDCPECDNPNAEG